MECRPRGYAIVVHAVVGELRVAHVPPPSGRDFRRGGACFALKAFKVIVKMSLGPFFVSYFNIEIHDYFIKRVQKQVATRMSTRLELEALMLVADLTDFHSTSTTPRHQA